MMGAQFEQMRKDMETQMGPQAASETKGQGPIVDAVQTPDGWSVDD